MEKYSKFCFFAILFCLLFSGCSKYDDYKKYTENGEIIYLTKVDSVKVFSGNKRIMFSWVTSDPRIVKYKIYWNLDADSLEVKVGSPTNNSAPDTMKVNINNLEEDKYEFNIVSFDVDNNHSVKSFVDGEVYGDNYKSTLLNRVIKSAVNIKGTELVELVWYKSDVSEIGVELVYTSSSGKQVNVIVPRDTIITKLTDFRVGSTINYRTLFLPAPFAIDIFYTNYNTIVPISK